MISVNNISKEFGGEVLFKDITFNINPKDRIGLAGVNGAGKSTLLKILAGELSSETGNVVLPNNSNVGYLPQEMKITSNATIVEEAKKVFSFINDLMAERDELHDKIANEEYTDDRYHSNLSRIDEIEAMLTILSPETLEANTEKYLLGLGFKRSDLTRPLQEFSQGWQMRVEIVKLLLLQPQLLLLDEPTNHLDIESIQWVEQFLVNYPGAVVLVSHDRKLLDKVTNRTIEISNGKLYDYKASYSEYIVQRQEREELLRATHSNQQKEIDEIERFIERFRYKASKARQVQSRVKLLEKMDRIELDNIDKTAIHFRFPDAPHSGKVTIEGTGVGKSYGTNNVLDTIDFEVLRGENIAFIGKNGEGKSTLIKCIAGELDYSGEIKLGHQVIKSFFAQDQGEKLDPELTVFETIDNAAVGEIRKRIKSILGAFLFQGDDIHKKVKVLSGGEKSRLALALMLLSPSNLLLLDEPTNHLDMRTKDILKSALLSYDGTVVIVSHDRDFLSGLTNRIYEFRNKKIKEFRGDIEEFIEKKNIESLDELSENRKQQSISKENKSESKQNWEEKKDYDRKIRKIKKDISLLEEEIEKLESELDIVNVKLANPEDNAEELRSGELYKQHDLINEKLTKAYNNWELRSEDLEQLL